MCAASLKHIIPYVHYKFFLCVLCLPPSQAALLNSFPDIFDELLQMFTVQEVAEYVRGTLGSMPSTVDIGQSMDVVKLQSIARTVESRLFFFPGETNVKVYAVFSFSEDTRTTIPISIMCIQCFSVSYSHFFLFPSLFPQSLVVFCCQWFCITFTCICASRGSYSSVLGS